MRTKRKREKRGPLVQETPSYPHDQAIFERVLGRWFLGRQAVGLCSGEVKEKRAILRGSTSPTPFLGYQYASKQGAQDGVVLF